LISIKLLRWAGLVLGGVALCAALFPAGGTLARDKRPVAIDPGNFVATIDNELMPLAPGTTFYYRGEKEGTPTTNVTYVSHRTKVIMGVTTIEVSDNAYEDGVLAEQTLDWYAQDKRGNVWYFGEDTKELDAEGKVVSTEGTWLAGVDGAMPGTVMKAEPKKGQQYAQEVAPGVAEDMAKVLSEKKHACVDYGCFQELLLTKEWTRLNPGVVEHKFYAEGVGLVRADIVKGGDEHMELVRITHD
jgi:hypothetical protein